MGILEGKVAIVTGADSVLGRATVRLMAREGAAVVAAGTRRYMLDLLVDGAETHGRRVITVRYDIFSEKDLDDLVRTTVETYGTVDILVNIAKRDTGKSRRLEDPGAVDAPVYYRPGMLPMLLLMQKCLPYMKEKRYGRIVNTFTLSAPVNLPGGLGYEMVRESVCGLTRFAAMEWVGYGIAVNALLPSREEESEGRKPHAARSIEAMTTSLLKHRDGLRDASAIILFLASEAAGDLSGQLIEADS